jgi:uncharacterized membrane protein YphA (DoxX/SURF4 family)
MINPFPIAYLSLVAYAALRVILGLILLNLGYRHMTKDNARLTEALRACVPTFARLAPGFAIYFAVVELALGAAFVAGFYTQIAAMVAVVYALKLLYLRNRLADLIPSPSFFLLMIGVSISLFITGAGILAMDIPI